MRHHQRRKFWLCFVDAGRGFAYLVKTERNARIHLAAVTAVFIAGLLFNITPGEWCIIVIASALVWIAEAFNTAVERVTDLLSPEIHEQAGNAKDVAAAGVMMAAIAAVAVGAWVFLPYVTEAVFPN